MLYQNQFYTDTLPAGSALSITSTGTGLVTFTSPGQITKQVSISSSTTLGPFQYDQLYRVSCLSGTINLTEVLSDAANSVATLATDLFGNVTGLVGPGGVVPLGRTYTGLVASRCNIPSSLGAGNAQAMARSRHVAMDTITALQVVYGNWYVISSTYVETGPGAPATIECSIEYPVGTYTRVTFGGANQGVCASAANIVSDSTAVSIPIGAAFYVRTYWLCSAGMPYTIGNNINNATGTSTTSGELFAYGASVPNTVLGGAINNTGTTTYFRPQAIIGRTKKVSWWLAGDSRLGQGATTVDSASDVFGLVGELERMLGKDYACINAGRNSESLRNASTNYVLRLALSTYCSHIACEHGINDFDSGGRTAPTVLADAVTFRNLFAGKPFWQSTISPASTSTDSFATTGNQTPRAANTARVAYNALIRFGSAPFDGYFEVADLVESARDSGVWKAPGYTTDGLHGQQLAMLAVQSSAKIPTFNPC